jgi:hypothetical protein
MEYWSDKNALGQPKAKLIIPVQKSGENESYRFLTG